MIKKTKYQDDTEWHKWFAWHPVIFIDNGSRIFVWLDYVERKRPFCWHYRLIEEKNT